MLEKIKTFLHEVKIEGKKVNYPSKDELIGSTWVVVITVVIMSLYLGAIDLVLAKIVNFMIR
jgi:preprotein translocase subunit SecE